MNVLVLNCGSSSVKFQLLDMNTETVLAKGIVERIGAGQARLKYQTAGGKLEKEPPEVNDHAEAIQVILDQLTDAEAGVLGSVKEIDAVGHRVVHGGERMTRSVPIDDEVHRVIEECVPLAPLHNPANIKGIDAATMVLPDVPQVGVFDTAFHQTMPRTAFLYAVPAWLYEKYRLRRYGFHGTSHRYVTEAAAGLLGRPLQEANLITCHLGNGCSITAVENGKSVDTSMGMTPLEGLVMGTRSGDVDPALVFHLVRALGMSVDQVDDLLNRRSGLLGLSGVSNDLREVTKSAKGGHDRAAVALEIFCYRLRKYIGAYTAVLGRVDALVFTGGIGENAAHIREGTCRGLEPLGYVLDAARNAGRSRGPRDLAAADSPKRILVIPTDEEALIARDTARIARSAANPA